MKQPIKKIIASKEQSTDFCYKFVSACLYSNHINTYGKYIDFFEFKLKIYLKKVIRKLSFSIIFGDLLNLLRKN